MWMLFTLDNSILISSAVSRNMVFLLRNSSSKRISLINMNYRQSDLEFYNEFIQRIITAIINIDTNDRILSYRHLAV